MLFGTGDIDEAEDGETILHEFGHALQDAIWPDFGQSQEAAAMGEGFGDYFAASFTAEKKIGRGTRIPRHRDELGRRPGPGGSGRACDGSTAR